jgi:hypothetical protein
MTSTEARSETVTAPNPDGSRQRPVEWGRWLARERAALLRRHWLFGVVFLAAVLVRVLAVVAYRHGIGFPDSRDYLATAHSGVPSPSRPAGYSWFITPFVAAGRSDLILVVQHLLGLALLVGGYAFLIRRGARIWLATLAVLPLALDGHLVSLESFVLAETLFTVLLFAGAALLTRRPGTGLGIGVLAGLLFSGAALTRTVGLPLGALALLYLLFRRAGGRVIAGFTVALVLPLALYPIYYHHYHGAYAFGQFQGRNLYARTATFSDCAKLTLPADLTWLCLKTPVSARYQRTDIYIWTDNNPATKAHGLDPSDDAALGQFAKLAMTQQFGDYLAVVVRETGWYLVPGTGPTDRSSRCLMNAWLMPGQRSDLCQTFVIGESNPSGQPDVVGMSPADPHALLRRVLHQYAVASITPRLLLSLLLLVPIVALLWRRRSTPTVPRTAEPALALDGLFLSAIGLALLVIPVATLMFDVRYGIPSVAFLPLGAALALCRFPFARRSAG